MSMVEGLWHKVSQGVNIMIVDSHQHLGGCFTFDHHVDEDELINSMNKNGIDTSMVMPFPGTNQEVKVHNEIADMAKKYPGRIYGMISINPHREYNEYMQEVERCIKMGFRAIKLHPLGHACMVTGKDADKIFQAAKTFDIPVIIHTGMGVPFTLPSVVVPRAKEYPDLKIILAHAGAYIYSSEAELIAKEFSNIYLETSWVGAPHRIKSFVKSIGAQRVMMGADLIDNMENELTKFRSIKSFSKEELDLCLGLTAKNVFKL